MEQTILQLVTKGIDQRFSDGRMDGTKRRKLMNGQFQTYRKGKYMNKLACIFGNNTRTKDMVLFINDDLDIPVSIAVDG